MLEDVQRRLKKKNKILFTRESACLQELISLIRIQKHRTLVLWAFACVKEPLSILVQKYPNEQRFKIAYELCYQWARGEVKMPIAKRAILDCHQACKAFDSEQDIALCHALGQGLSTVHVETHAIGLAIYELSAIVFESPKHYQDAVQKKIEYYLDTLRYHQAHVDQEEIKWADFLLVDDVENKEDVLWRKKENEQV